MADDPREMVQRVADALRAECRNQYGTDWSYDVAWKFAKAAIDAMREPTPEMYWAAAASQGIESNTMREHWQAMLTEAVGF